MFECHQEKQENQQHRDGLPEADSAVAYKLQIQEIRLAIGRAQMVNHNTRPHKGAVF